MADDANIKEMAQLLRQGATMLDLSCPQCGNLLFRLTDGKIYCPTCKKQVIIEKSNEDMNRTSENFHETQNSVMSQSTLSLAVENIVTKINEISSLLVKEKQMGIIDEYITILERLVDLLKEISKTIR